MDVLARIPALPTDAADAPAAAPDAGPAPAPAPPAPRPRPAAGRETATRAKIPDWSIAALAAVALAVWSLAAWRDADHGGPPERIAIDVSVPSDPTMPRTR